MADSSNCPSCGAEHRPTDNFCANCGARVRKPEDAPCRACGALVPIGGRFCVECGADEPHRVISQDADDRPTSRTPARAAAAASAAKPVRAAGGEAASPRVTAPRAAVKPNAAPPTDAAAPKPAARPIAPPIGRITAAPRPVTRIDAPAPAAPSKPTARPASKPAASAPSAPTTAPRAAAAPAKVTAPKPVTAPSPVAPAGDGPLAAPAGWPDITDELAEVRFLLLQGFEDEAATMLGSLRTRFVGHPDLERFDAAATEPPPIDHAEKRRRDQAVTVRTEPVAAAAAAVAADAARAAVAAAAPEPTPPPVASVPAPSTPKPRVPPRGLTIRSEPVQAGTVVAPPPAEPAAPRAAKRTTRPPDPASLVEVSPITRVPVTPADSAAETLEFDVDAEFGDGLDDPAAMSTAAGLRTSSGTSPDFEDSGETLVDVEFERLDRTVVAKAPPAPPKFDDDETTGTDHRAQAPAAAATAEGTVIARAPSPPSPWQGARDEPGDAPAEGVATLTRTTVVSVDERPSPPARTTVIPTETDRPPPPSRTTVIPTETDRPPPPSPFGGAPVPGSTLVPGTSPQPGGFADDGDDADDAATVSLPSLRDSAPISTSGTPAVEVPPGTSTRTPAVTGLTAPPGTLRPVDAPTPAVTGRTQPPTQAAPAPAATQPKARGRGRREPRTAGVRVIMLGPRGEPVAERTVESGGHFDLGREPGQPWSDDLFIEPQHVRLQAADGGVRIHELVPTGAVFLRITGRVPIREGDQVRVGQSLITYEVVPGDPQSGPWGRIMVHAAPEGGTHAIPLGNAPVMIGRELGDITLPGDTFVSSTHCRIGNDGKSVFIEDLESSNGTYVRMRSGDRVEVGQCVLVGQTQFVIRKR